MTHWFHIYTSSCNIPPLSLSRALSFGLIWKVTPWNWDPGQPFWELDYLTWAPIVTSSWLKSTWHNMHTTGLNVHGPHTLVSLARINDTYLMDCFVSHQAPPGHLHIINEIRGFKQVTCLSDIVMADGIYIDASTFMPPSLPNKIPTKRLSTHHHWHPMTILKSTHWTYWTMMVSISTSCCWEYSSRQYLWVGLTSAPQ